MLTTFNDFLGRYPKYLKYGGNKEVMSVFDLLSRPESIFAMICANKTKKSALSGCVIDVTKHVKNFSNFTLKGPDADTQKQAVGSMVRSILEPFGLVPDKQIRINPVLGSPFSSATHYREDPSLQKLKISLIIESI